MEVASIARIAHEVNRSYCNALGDDSQLSWEDAPQWQRDSAINGTEFHLGGDHGPEASHESWMSEKLEAGWVWGPSKDENLKHHPCIMPFDELPPDQQAKDFIFRGVVLALASCE